MPSFELIVIENLAVICAKKEKNTVLFLKAVKKICDKNKCMLQ